MSRDFGRIKYFINEDKGIVVAKFTDNYFGNKTDHEIWYALFLDSLYRINNKTERATNLYDDTCEIMGFGRDNVENEATDYINQNNELYGIAKCHPKDKFDAEIGKEIARKKLLRKYYKFENSMLLTVYEKFTRFTSTYYNNLEARIRLCRNKIDKNTICPSKY